MPDARLPERDLPVATAFAGLPLEAPERSAWPRLAERFAAQDRPRAPRWPFGLAAAAALVLAVALPNLSPPGPGPVPPAADPPVAAAGPDLPALMRESARLENLIAAVSNDDAGSASALALGLEFEERLQRLDSALSEPGLAEEDRRLLWQQRVGLLRDFAGLQGTRQWLASEGTPLDGDPVAVF